MSTWGRYGTLHSLIACSSPEYHRYDSQIDPLPCYDSTAPGAASFPYEDQFCPIVNDDLGIDCRPAPLPGAHTLRLENQLEFLFDDRGPARAIYDKPNGDRVSIDMNDLSNPDILTRALNARDNGYELHFTETPAFDKRSMTNKANFVKSLVLTAPVPTGKTLVDNVTKTLAHLFPFPSLTPTHSYLVY